jgi:protein-L-isoaspartate O-methyltransferase
MLWLVIGSDKMASKNASSLMRQAAVTISHKLFQMSPRAALGTILLKLSPTLEQKALENFFVPGNENFMVQLAQAALTQQYYQQSDAAMREANRAKFWGVAGKGWHDRNDSEIVKGARTRDKDILSEWIVNACLTHKIETICEIGAGNGHYLGVLSDRLSEAQLNVRLIGFDLSNNCIKEARSRNLPAEFFQGDAFDALREVPKQNVLFVAIGTLEYFTPLEIESFFTELGKLRDCLIAFAEPINLDRRSEFVSKPRAYALAWSHNYEYLLFKAGMELLRARVFRINPEVPFHESVLILAKTKESNEVALTAVNYEDV